MSYDVSLTCTHCKNPLHVETHMEGGTYAICGTDEASLNVTYNYGALFADALGYANQPGMGFSDYLDGRIAASVVDDLQRAVDTLGTKTESDYWKPTPGNAGHALAILLAWAKQYPDSVFVVH